ncbi:mucin-17-like [Dendronephthya gigantea]|uniref:mucin-17-like n=1 Tax=Dendronephthya gigantea TaxID=151771 RepID=UPI001069AE82|nr:mucin-17-like [Dendronephthya gigantea]
MSCTWTIFSTIGQKVLLQFSLFKLESHPSCAWDYLDVYDGDSKHAPRLGRFCGDNFPRRLVSSGSKLHLVFYADNNMRAEGFILNFTSIYYEISSPVAILIQSSTVNRAVLDASSDLHESQETVISTAVNNMSTTVLSDVTSKTIPVTLRQQSSKHIRHKASSRHSELRTHQVDHRTELPSTASLPIRSSTVNSLTLGTSDSHVHVLSEYLVTTPVNDISTKLFSDVILKTLPVMPEKSSSVVIPIQSSTVNRAVLDASSDLHVSQETVISTAVNNMSTTVLSDVTSKTIPVTLRQQSSKHLGLNASSRHSELRTHQVDHRTEIPSTISRSVQSTTVNSVPFGKSYSQVLSRNVITKPVNNMSTTLLPADVISKTLPSTQNSKHIGLITSSRHSALTTHPVDHATEISSTASLPIQSSTVNSIALGKSESHVLSRNLITTRVNNMSTTLLPDVIFTTLPLTPSGKHIGLNTSSKHSDLSIRPVNLRTEISSTVSLSVQPSTVDFAALSKSDSYVLLEDVITTHVSNMSTTVPSAVIVTTLPLTASSKHIGLNNSSRHSNVGTHQVDHRTEVSSTVSLPLQSSTVNSLALGKSDSHVLSRDVITSTTPVSRMSTTVPSAVILPTLPLTASSKLIRLRTLSRDSDVRLNSFEHTTEISSTAALPIQSSTVDSVAQGTNVLSENLIATRVNNMSTTLLADVILTTLPLTRSSKHIGLNTSSKHSDFRTHQVHHRTDIPSTVSLSLQSSTVDSVPLGSNVLSKNFFTTRVNNMSTTLLPDVILTTLPLTPSSEHIGLNTSSKHSDLRIHPVDHTTEIPSTASLPIRSSTVNSLTLGTSDSHVHVLLSEYLVTTPVNNMSTKLFSDVILKTLPVTPGSKHIGLKTSSRHSYLSVHPINLRIYKK